MRKLPNDQSENSTLQALIDKRTEVINTITEIKEEISKSDAQDSWTQTLLEMRDDFIIQIGLLAEAINKMEEAISFSNQKLADVQELLDSAQVTIGEHKVHKADLINSSNDAVFNKKDPSHGQGIDIPKQYKKRF